MVVSLNAGKKVEEALQTYCKCWCKKEDIGVHDLNDCKNEVLRINATCIMNILLHIYIYENIHLVVQQRHTEKEKDKFHGKYVFAPADKAANNVTVV